MQYAILIQIGHLLLVIRISTDKERKPLKITDNGLGINLEKYGKKLLECTKTFHKHRDSRGIGLFITKIKLKPWEEVCKYQGVKWRGNHV